MSVMEKRLQLLLDQERYRRVQQEADRSGRSVAAVIREAIDVRFAADEEAAAQAAALDRFLAMTEEPSGPSESWQEIKAALDDELAARYPYA